MEQYLGSCSTTTPLLPLASTIFPLAHAHIHIQLKDQSYSRFGLIMNFFNLLQGSPSPSPHGKLGLPHHTHQQRLHLYLSQMSLTPHDNFYSIPPFHSLLPLLRGEFWSGILKIPNSFWILQIMCWGQCPSPLMVTFLHA